MPHISRKPAKATSNPSAHASAAAEKLSVEQPEEMVKGHAHFKDYKPLENYAHSGDHARCRSMLRHGSLSFHAAAQLLPLSVRRPVTVLYAFCRLSDDAVDMAIDGQAALERLYQRLDRVFDGRPFNQPVDRAFTDLINRYHLPRLPFDLLLEGFQWDVEGRTYHTVSDVTAYGVRVAGTVGVLMAVLMGAKSREALARAADMGIAMQFTNIARDVGEDANAGRLYLPRDWIESEGMCVEEFLAEPMMTPALGRITARLLKEADCLYARSDAGLAELPFRCRLSIRSARQIYAEIGQQVKLNHYDNINHRAYVSLGRKLGLMSLAAIKPGTQHRSDFSSPPLPEAEDLVNALKDTRALAAEDTKSGRVQSFFQVLKGLQDKRPLNW